jgi:hypothetical protein
LQNKISKKKNINGGSSSINSNKVGTGKSSGSNKFGHHHMKQQNQDLITDNNHFTTQGSQQMLNPGGARGSRAHAN